MIRPPTPDLQRAAQAFVAAVMSDDPVAFVASHKALHDAQREAEQDRQASAK